MSGRRDFDLPALRAGVLAGEKRAVARAITLVENRDELAYELVREIYPHTGGAMVAGFTGPPGVGKSSLLSSLVTLLRSDQKTVGMVSVDPSSPFSHGAVLGDRIRLSDHFLDAGVFIRSMSTRGHLGGISEATLQALLVLDASGKDVLLLETVGVGQSEVDVATSADTVVLVLMPGSGDSVQALKAGVMEIPDVIVINKADHPAARTMRSEIRSILSLDRDRPWKPPIVETEAIRGEGVDQLWAAVLEHRAFLERDGGLEQRRRRSIEHEVVAVAVAQARRRLSQAVEGDAEVRRLLDRVHARELDPLTATREIAERVLKLGRLARRGRERRPALGDDLVGVAAVVPAADHRVGAVLEVLVDVEEVRDLVEQRVADVGDVVHVAPGRVLERHAQHLVVLALLVGHLEDADRLHRDHAPRERRRRHQDHRVHRVAVAPQRVHQVSVVGWIDNARPERAVEHHPAQRGVVLVLVAAALRDLHEGVQRGLFGVAGHACELTC